jgi:hypothetical protein
MLHAVHGYKLLIGEENVFDYLNIDVGMTVLYKYTLVYKLIVGKQDPWYIYAALKLRTV